MKIKNLYDALMQVGAKADDELLVRGKTLEYFGPDDEIFAQRHEYADGSAQTVIYANLQ